LTSERITELLNIIESRQSHYSELRAIAAGALPSIWSDWRHYEPAGSIAADIVSVLEASLIGRVDLRVDPDDAIADQLITLLYSKHLHPLVRESVRDFIICGWGGIVTTPWGPARLKPEHAVAGKDWYLRRYELDVRAARQRFGKRRVFDGRTGDILLVETLEDGRLQVRFGDAVVFSQPWDYEPRLLVGDERPRLVDNSLHGAPISIIESCRDLFIDHHILRQMIVRRAAMAGLVQVVSAQLEDPASADNIAKRWDTVLVRDGSAVFPLDQRSLAELMTIQQQIEQAISARSGVSLFQRGISDPHIQTATEAALMQSQTNTRLVYLQSLVRDWLNDCVADYRRYLVNLPDNELEYIEFPMDGTTQYFGAGRHYSEALAGRQVSVALSGYRDIAQRQQEVMALLPVLQQTGGNTRPLLEELIRLSGRDPKLYLEQQGV
jgi:hypothetical protein